MKINTQVKSDKTDGQVRHIILANQFAEIQVNVCDEMNLVVIHKTFKSSNLTHSLQTNKNELERIIETIYKNEELF